MSRIRGGVSTIAVIILLVAGFATGTIPSMVDKLFIEYGLLGLIGALIIAVFLVWLAIPKCKTK